MIRSVRDGLHRAVPGKWTVYDRVMVVFCLLVGTAIVFVVVAGYLTILWTTVHYWHPWQLAAWLIGPAIAARIMWLLVRPGDDE